MEILQLLMVLQLEDAADNNVSGFDAFDSVMAKQFEPLSLLLKAMDADDDA